MNNNFFKQSPQLYFVLTKLGIVKPSKGEVFAGLPFFIFNSSGLSKDEKLVFHNYFDLDELL
jgi:hypothetical protein